MYSAKRRRCKICGVYAVKSLTSRSDNFAVCDKCEKELGLWYL